MKRLTLAWLMLAVNVWAQDYHLPFTGRWFVMQGGDTPNVNSHMADPSQWYGIDFAKVGGLSGRAAVRGEGTDLADYYSWREPVLSPVDGEVKVVVDRLPDNRLGVRDELNPAGNHVVIAAATNRYVFIQHFLRGSIKVKPGQRVAVGQELGRCGNSGHSDFPHIHMHVQDTPIADGGAGQNMVFKRVHVELSGKTFQNVDWPMIRGLFVWKQ